MTGSTRAGSHEWLRELLDEGFVGLNVAAQFAAGDAGTDRRHDLVRAEGAEREAQGIALDYVEVSRLKTG